MIKRNVNRLIVLVVSWCMVYFIDQYIKNFYLNYTFLSFSCFTIILYCSIFIKDKLLVGYSTIQLLALSNYILLMTHFDYIAYLLLYDGFINVSNIMLAYEAILFLISGGAVGLFILDRLRNVFSIFVYSN